MVMYRDDDGGGEFTFAVLPPLAGVGGVFHGGNRIGAPAPPYPLFGRPRSPSRLVAPEPTATTRVPLGCLLLLVDRRSAPAETSCHCPLCPGSPAAASPARCRKSGSTGSAVLRWRQRLVGRSHSDGKAKFVFLDDASTSTSERKGRSDGGGADGGGGFGGHAWSWYARRSGGNGGRRRSFLPYRQDLVGLFGYATLFRRSCHPF